MAGEEHTDLGNTPDSPIVDALHLHIQRWYNKDIYKGTEIQSIMNSNLMPTGPEPEPQSEPKEEKEVVFEGEELSEEEEYVKDEGQDRDPQDVA